MSKTFADALKPLSQRLRRADAATAAISQVTLSLARNPRSFVRARECALKWMAGRSGRPLPAGAFDGLPFALDEIGAQRAEAVALESPRYWAARIDDADKEVASRSWITEIGIAEDGDGNVQFGCRLTASSLGGDLPDYRTVPGFVREIVQSVGATLDGRPVTGRPWIVTDKAEVLQLAGLMSRADRRADLIVLAVPEDSEDTTATACSAAALARRLAGVAHVAVLGSRASFHLSDLVGRDHSVFRSAVRTYRPGFDPDRCEPYSHPLTMPAKIAAWPGGTGAFETVMVERTLLRSVREDARTAMPSFAQVKDIASAQRIAQIKRDDRAADPDLIALLESEVASLRKAVEDEREMGAELLRHAEAEREAALAEVRRLESEAIHLRARLRAMSAAAPQPAASIPTTVDGFQEWCETNLSGSVDVLSRAMQGVKKSIYKDPSLIYKALIMIRDFYVPMRRDGRPEQKEAFRAECGRLGLAYEPTGDRSRAGEHREQYFVKYRGEHQYLAFHFKKGNAMDQRHCFRVYLFWDTETEQAVVGWLPSHLENRLT